MNKLKLEYNELLKRYNNGVSAMADVKDDKEKEDKYLKELEKIQLRMNDLLMQIEDYSEDESVNGFAIEKTTEIVVNDVSKEIQPIQEIKPSMSFLDTYQQNWNMAVQLSKSSIIPDNYKGHPENVMIALELAQNMNLTPFLVMQNLGIIKGKTSWSGSFCKFLIERTGKYKNLELNYIGNKQDDSYGCYLSAIRISDGKQINGPEVTMATAKAEGWTSNKKWSTLKDLMLAYRCQSFFARIYCPEALNGIYTTEEIEDINNQPKEVKDVL